MALQGQTRHFDTTVYQTWESYVHHLPILSHKGSSGNKWSGQSVKNMFNPPEVSRNPQWHLSGGLRHLGNDSFVHEWDANARQGTGLVQTPDRRQPTLPMGGVDVFTSVSSAWRFEGIPAGYRQDCNFQKTHANPAKFCLSASCGELSVASVKQNHILGQKSRNWTTIWFWLLLGHSGIWQNGAAHPGGTSSCLILC